MCTVSRSPWKNPYVERIIGSIRRECLDRLIILSATHFHRILRSYLAYYHRSRTHRFLNKDTQDAREYQSREMGPIHAIPMVWGLRHGYTRRVALGFEAQWKPMGE